MDINKLTFKTQELLHASQNLANDRKNSMIDAIHIAHISITNADLIQSWVQSHEIDLNSVSKNIEEELHKLPTLQNSTDSQIGISSEVHKAISQGISNMKNDFDDDFLSPEVLFYYLLSSSSSVKKIFNTLNKESLKKYIMEKRKGNTIKDASNELIYDALEKYAINLNQQAEKGKLDPVIGRDEEIRRVLHILSRKTKNNPILIGEPGVGKTAIVEGIAKRIVNGDVPDNLKDLQIYGLDMGALIAGAKYKGEFEERLKSVVKEVVDSNGQIVLFIDEIHTLIGAGKSEGAMDAANILKPSLARGELRSIGATTLDEYQKYFEKDKAMERRFQKITIDEPSVEDGISILRGLKERYERYHNVEIQDDAIIASVKLSDRYITDRFLPDKAIDLIDEAAAKLRLEINSVPEELDELNRKIMQLEIEKEAIKREKDKVKLKEIDSELNELATERDAIQSKWEYEKSFVDKIQSEKSTLEALKLEAEQAERSGDLAKVAELRYGKITQVEKNIAEYEEELSGLDSEKKLMKEYVTSEDIAEIVSKWTGVPIKNLIQSEKDKLLNLDIELKKRVKGQDQAVMAVSNAILRSRAGLQNPNRPIGSFLFLGSTGVGKTELAKTLSESLFNDENAYIRIDMSEYQEKHSVSRLVGAPPGYVGYDESGQLTEAVRRKPYSVILLDEIEKAHPDVFNILLQVLDDGRLTDNKGRLINFKNTIIIMTSNMGSRIINEEFEDINEDDYTVTIPTVKHKVVTELKSLVKPEFLNRIDDIVMFSPLRKRVIKEIIAVQLNNLTDTLKDKNIEMTFNDAVLDYLTEYGYDVEFGARPLKRIIQTDIINLLSRKIISGEISSHSKIKIDCIDDHIVIL